MPVHAPARLIQLAVAVVGLVNTAAAIGLLFAPRWFYENVGDFPPYNRHYAGDAGTFLLPVGIALVLVSRRPWDHPWVVGIGASVSVLHAANHAYDAAGARESAGDLVPLVVGALALALAFFAVLPRRAGR
jgi:hypothetical protein